MKIKSENLCKAYIAAKHIQKKHSVIFIFDKEFCVFTGKTHILDIYFYNAEYDIIEWVYGVEHWDDDEIKFPYYTFITLKRFVMNSFNTDDIFISGNKIPDYIRNKDIIKCNDEKVFEAETDTDMFFKINSLKIQMYLNYMDTDSIPFYMKNIGVIYNEYSEFKKAYIWLENALRMNSNNDIYDQLIISMTGMKCFNRLICSIIEPETFIQISSLAFAYKNKGDLIKSLEYYKKAYEQKNENWIMEDIKWIENEINKKN